MAQPLTIIIVERGAQLTSLTVKNFKEEELFKKCGFKSANGFNKHCEWTAKFDGKKYYIELFGKDDGRANYENKYDFPPPIDNKLLFGSCVLVAHLKVDSEKKYIDLTLPLWNKIYEKLFGGFEDLAATAAEDEAEEDELANVPKHKKTKTGGYLKDGFVVDSSDTEDSSKSSDSDLDEDEDEDDDTEDTNAEAEDADVVIEELGSELSEDSYDYSDNEKDDE